MATPLTFEFDEIGDILHIGKVAPYAEQETEQLAYDVTARRNPRTGAVENLEVLFFTRHLLKETPAHVNSLRDLFAEPGAATPS